MLVTVVRTATWIGSGRSDCSSLEASTFHQIVWRPERYEATVAW